MIFMKAIRSTVDLCTEWRKGSCILTLCRLLSRMDKQECRIYHFETDCFEVEKIRLQKQISRFR
jgi:hypothetical protein